VRDGKIKAFAVTGKTRSAAAPEIPTVDEAGLPGFHFSVWNATWAPKGTPKTIVGKLNSAVIEALTDPTVRTRLMDLGQEIFPQDQQTPAARYAFQKAEIEKWWPIDKGRMIVNDATFPHAVTRVRRALPRSPQRRQINKKDIVNTEIAVERTIAADTCGTCTLYC
jgi:hypothetical protein